jgi:DNA polymerase III sliding clamp (beta) subunit (PCNA family)
MRLRTTAAALREACASAETAARPAGNIEIAASEAGIHVTGGDGEIGIRRKLAGSVEAHGSVVCQAKALISYAGALAEDTVLDVTKESTMLRVTGGGRVYKFSVIEQQYLPVEEPGEGGHIVAADGLTEALAAIRHAIDPRNPLVKCSVNGGELYMYSTDMYRGAAASFAVDGDGSWAVLFPAGGLQTGLRLRPHSMHIDPRGRIAAFYGESFLISVRLAAAEFPAIESVLAQRGETKWILHTTETLRALKRLAAVAGGEALRCEIAEEELCIQASSGEGVGVEYVGVVGEASGAFGVNIQLMVDALEAIGDEEATLQYQDPRKALHVSGRRGGCEVVCVVMPVVY